MQIVSIMILTVEEDKETMRREDMVKENVYIAGNRTSITLNWWTVELRRALDGEPSMQELIDRAERVPGAGGAPNKSQWCTALITAEAVAELREHD